MSDRPLNPAIPPAPPSIKTPGTAPFIYFDIAPNHGVMNGTIEIEVAARTLTTTPNGGVGIEFITTGHLRCSPTAAKFLRDSLDLALKMFEQLQQGPAVPNAAPGKLN